MQPSLRKIGRRAFTRTDEHSGFNLLQAAVLERDVDTVRKASVHLENFVEEMNCRMAGKKASLYSEKLAAVILSPFASMMYFPVDESLTESAADILSAVKGGKESGSLITEIYEEFVETERTLTKLHSCAKSNDVEMAIELVLNYAMDVNVTAERNITPLVWASTAASSLSIETLIDLGADVNAEAFVDSTFCFCGSTALQSAIHGNNAAVVKLLLANEVDVNIGDQQGNTALHSSTSKQFCYISQLLIDSGCEINGSNNRGETPLYSAVRGNNIADVQLLLKNKADANFKGTLGNTPLHVSTDKGFSDI